ncbi:hypothetical protein AVEN_58506-1 [Araneus ventricosus]|uniref:Uncharacterized protein n=1 Tax=Araneus ventricosus TaxID=182803 RepID=A0A4Y2IAI6_ARAVE|nr:hypothetical protein AVEN_58506-1 [Araneus ventricosus]
MFSFGTRFETRVPVEMAARDGYRSKPVVRKDSLLMISYNATKWFMHEPCLKTSRFGLRISVPKGAWEWVLLSIDSALCVQCTALASLCIG